MKERNWLVHNSLEENRKASINDGCFEAFLLRLEAMVNETNALMRELLVRAEELVLSRGVRADQIEAKTAETLKLWRG